MNRTLVFGFALFFAVLGFAVTGSEKEATAGHRCHGGNAGCHGGLFSRLKACHGGFAHHRASRCQGQRACHGRRHCHGGLFARLRARKSCNGCYGDSGCHAQPVDCCGTPEPVVACPPACHGEAVEMSAPVEAEAPEAAEAAPEVPPAPSAEDGASVQVGTGYIVRTVSYRN